MKFLGLCGVLLAAWLATGGAKAQEAAVKELTPTGKLRFGVAFAPKMSALFVVKDAGGSPRGVTVDLGNELAQRLGVPIEFMVATITLDRRADRCAGIRRYRRRLHAGR